MCRLLPLALLVRQVSRLLVLPLSGSCPFLQLPVRTPKPPSLATPCTTIAALDLTMPLGCLYPRSICGLWRCRMHLEGSPPVLRATLEMCQSSKAPGTPEDLALPAEVSAARSPVRSHGTISHTQTLPAQSSDLPRRPQHLSPKCAPWLLRLERFSSPFSDHVSSCLGAARSYLFLDHFFVPSIPVPFLRGPRALFRTLPAIRAI